MLEPSPKPAKTVSHSRIVIVMLEAHLRRPDGDHRSHTSPFISRHGDRPLSISTSVQAAPPPPPALSSPDAVARAIIASLDDAKAEDVLTIDLQGKTTIADTMVVANGRSTTHVGSIADRVIRACKDVGVLAKVEGLPHCDWVLVDVGDVVVHLFRAEVRQFYNLEKLWGVDRPSERQAAG